MAEITRKFVSKKIRKVCWRPADKDSFNCPNYFLTGSWDDYENCVSLWTLNNNNEANIDSKNNEPMLSCSIKCPGDVTDLRFIGGDLVVASSSTGSVILLKIRRNNQKIEKQLVWERCHRTVCTAVSSHFDQVSSVGEDGRINVLNITKSQPVHTIDDGDSCAIFTVSYVKHDEIITGNSRGQLKVWDLRTKSTVPSRNFVLSGSDQVGILCADHHPTENHVLSTGSEDGVLSIWDMRHDSYPVSLVGSHESAMMDVKFHPTKPDHLFTCSLDGSVWHWNGASLRLQSTHLPGLKQNETVDTRNIWLNCDATKHRLDISSLLPRSYKAVNSIDIDSDRLVCGTDNEAIYILRDLGL